MEDMQGTAYAVWHVSREPAKNRQLKDTRSVDSGAMTRQVNAQIRQFHRNAAMFCICLYSLIIIRISRREQRVLHGRHARRQPPRTQAAYAVWHVTREPAKNRWLKNPAFRRFGRDDTGECTCPMLVMSVPSGASESTPVDAKRMRPKSLTSA